MIFTADIGNTVIKLGMYDDGGNLSFNSQISADKAKTADEYAVMIRGVISLYADGIISADGAIISSVAPPVTQSVTGALQLLFGVSCLRVGPGIKTGLDIKTDNAAQLGADIVANTVGAFRITEKPFVVIDIGTATTVTAVNAAGELYGVAIMPGVRASLDVLSETSAELPDVSLNFPKNLLGRNTCDAMLAGTVNGTAFALDGYISALAEQNGGILNIIVTGGLASLVIPKMRDANILHHVPSLVLDGLYAIYELNRRQARQKTI